MRETSPFGQDSYIPGDQWMICDTCGSKFRRSEMKRQHDNLWVCKADYDPQHPQEFVRGKTDKIRVDVARPEGTDTMITTPITRDDL